MRTFEIILFDPAFQTSSWWVRGHFSTDTTAALAFTRTP
jgi:hypothetical protein